MRANLFSLLLMLPFYILAQIPTNGLVAWYPFNGNANDSSGNNYHPSTINATLTHDRFGNLNSAYYFDGAQGQYIEVPFITPFISNAHTICAWINTKSNAGRLVVSPMGGGQHFSLNVNNGGANIYTDCAPYNGHCVSTTTPINDSTWYHIAGVIDSSSQTMSIYINGVLNNSLSMILNYNCIPYQNLNIGRFPGYGEYYTGAIDEILIYNRALSASEISGIFNSNTLGIKEDKPNITSIYPNPFCSQTTIHLSKDAINATLTIINCVGQQIDQIKNINGRNIILHRNDIPNGVYFAYLTENKQLISAIKLIIAD